ncbi:putative quinol monooxygenase [Marininema halotolerans]|uniref:Quinol monooxygenase YgiN n=1 Tax=Marininema halotolerans TaxID=1155944 RepID=A0A1I6TNG1_9BACL|nr:putative quinol monooxygenase [Marininema halotolerans]SFS90772.1 Quinol monooxygenase YgiN [Marininema halotolerans]
MLTIVAKMVAKKGMEDRVQAELEKLIAPTRAEEGNIQYDLHQSIEDPAVFIFYENWESKELWENHMEADHLKEWGKVSGDIVESWELYQMEKK